ncbi:MAG TPA: WecB/TagA/CpsF family glycosyltransferase [Hydrogenophaga sp.]|nr:WecB/TagA/CpsF family glycosyltransferase [Hydrogenophaga sp.]
MNKSTTTDTCKLCGLSITRASLQVTLDALLDRIARGQGAWLLTLNTEMLSRGARDPSYFELIAQADIITADGMPLVWASRRKGPDQAIAGRTTGVDLVEAYLRLPTIPAFAIIGGQNPKVTLQRFGTVAVQACKYLFDGKVDLSDAQLSQFAQALSEHEVRTVFIALGVPKQDQLALRLRARLPHLVLMGIGGTFEILGPQGSRAPQWMQNAGLEWLYRLAKEPGRLWRRYLINYPAGIGLLLKDGRSSRTP